MDATKEALAEAAPHLPAFCTILRGYYQVVWDPQTRDDKRVLCATFTFPGATGHGTWRADLPEMCTVAADDYQIYQRLKREQGGVENDQLIVEIQKP